MKMVALGGQLAELAMEVVDLLPVLGELPLACALVLRGGERARQAGLGLGPLVPHQVGVEVVLGGDLVDRPGAPQRPPPHHPRLELGGVGFAPGHVNLAFRAFLGTLCGLTPGRQNRVQLWRATLPLFLQLDGVRNNRR